MSRITEVVALLRESGPWSDEFDTVRLPLANLLNQLEHEKLARSRVSVEVDKLLDALEGLEWSAYEPLETWIMNSERTLNSIGITDGKSAAIRAGIARLMRAL